MTNKEFMNKVLAAHGLTDKPVKHDGKWVYPSDYRLPNDGEIYGAGDGTLRTALLKFSMAVCPIYTPCTLPPKPTAEWIKANTPDGKAMVVADEPDLESVPYVSCQLSAPLMLMEHRNGITPFDKFHGLRYGVTIKDAEPDASEKRDVLRETNFGLAAIKPDAVRTCEHDWQGLECAKCGQPKSEQVKEIEQLPDFHMWDNPSEVVDAINRLNKAVNELRKGKV